MQLEKQQTRPLDSLTQQINEEHHRCEAAASEALEHAIKAGEGLMEAKAKCPHGEWGKWLNANFDGSERTAQTYMRLYNERDRLQNRNGVADLSLRRAVAQLAKSETNTEESTAPTVEVEEPTITSDPLKLEAEETRHSGVFNQITEIMRAIESVDPNTFADYFLSHSGDLEEMYKTAEWLNDVTAELKGRTKKPKGRS